MKKEYMKPKTEVVVLKVNNHLLAGSEPVSVSKEVYEEGMTDL